MIAATATLAFESWLAIDIEFRTGIVKSILTWLGEKFFPGTDEVAAPPVRPWSHVNTVASRPKPRAPQKPASPESIELSRELAGTIEDGGPGKNIYMRSQYVREDTGTHETLKILDDSIHNSLDEDSSDPYNTGRFDRSQSWKFRSRK